MSHNLRYVSRRVCTYRTLYFTRVVFLSPNHNQEVDRIFQRSTGAHNERSKWAETGERSDVLRACALMHTRRFARRHSPIHRAWKRTTADDVTYELLVKFPILFLVQCVSSRRLFREARERDCRVNKTRHHADCSIMLRGSYCNIIPEQSGIE